MTEDETNCQRIGVLEERITRLIDLAEERDRRYEERHMSSKEAVHAAFVASKDAVSAALQAQKESVVKAEESQRAYNVGHNDLTRKMDTQYSVMLPRPEADGKFKALEEKIADLRESRSKGAGEYDGIKAGWAFLLGFISLAGAIVAIVLAIRK